MDKSEKIFFIIFLTIIIFSISISTIINNSSKDNYNLGKLKVEVENEENDFEILEISNLSECDNLDLIKTSRCLRDYTYNFYKYERNENKIVTYEDEVYLVNNNEAIRFSGNIESYLRQNGGDCVSWTSHYYYLCNQTKFDCHIFTEDALEGVFEGHQYLVIYNSTNYCNIDGVNVKCMKTLKL